MRKVEKLEQKTDTSLLPASGIDNYFCSLTNTVISLEVQEIAALGPKFCSIPKPTTHNIIETIKNVEHTLKNQNYHMRLNRQSDIKYLTLSGLSDIENRT